jgi:hypothetical protein
MPSILHEIPFIIGGETLVDKIDMHSNKMKDYLLYLLMIKQHDGSPLKKYTYTIVYLLCIEFLKIHII